MFEKLVVPLDGSAVAEKILGSLEPLLLRPRAELLLLRVVQGRDAPIEEVDLADARAYIERTCTRLAAKGFRASGHVVLGLDPADAIVRFAGEQHASLICLATHGRTGLRRALLGSAAERVVRIADCPVLLVNPWVPGAPLQFKRVVVPLDGSERSEGVLAAAAELGRHFGSELILACVEDLPVGTGAELSAREHAWTVRSLEHATRVLGRANVRTLVRRGPPGPELIEAIREASPDVVLMTTHGRSGLARVALGSVAEHVIRHAPVPVLVERSRAATAHASTRG